MDLRLLKKYFENECSPKEATEVLQWIEQTNSEKEIEDEFNEVWQKIKVKPGDYSRWSGKLDKIHERIEMEDLYGSLNLKSKKSTENTSKDRPPVSGNYRYKKTYRNNGKFVITGIALISIVLVMAILHLSPKEDTKMNEPEIVQIEKSTEPGQKLSFHLEDGTRVLLNSSSRLIFPSKFDSLERKVVLEGEAFFEVSKETKRLFKVVTESTMTTALGTSFNINVFRDGKRIEVALVSGKVIVETSSDSEVAQTMILIPGEMATVLKLNNSIKKSPFDFQEKIAWKDGIIVFREATYKQVAGRLENWYGVNITSNTLPYKKWEFTGKFENESLENVLIGLQFGHKFDYTINGKDVKLKF